MLDDATSNLSYTLPVTTAGAPSPPAPDDSVTVVVDRGGLALRRSGGPEPARAERRGPAADTLELRCLYCEGVVQRGAVPVRLTRAGYSASLPRVPAWVCRRCEQPYFEPRAVERVLAALDEARESAQLLRAVSG
jgi:hypothetical protein